MEMCRYGKGMKISVHHNRYRSSRIWNQGGVTGTGFQPLGTTGPHRSVDLLLPCACSAEMSSYGFSGLSAVLLNINLKGFRLFI